MKTPVLAARLPAAAAQNDIPLPGGTGAKYRKMNTYAKPAANPRGIRTSKLIRLKVSWNEHLRKSGGRGGLIVTQPKTGNSSGLISYSYIDPHQHLIRT